MKILEIQSARCRVGAVVKERDKGDSACPLLDAIESLQAQEQASGDRLLNVFQLVAAQGLGALNSKQFHQVDKNHGIYEFIAGRLRVLFFKGDSGQVVICTHLFMKKGQKTPDEEKDRAIKMKKRHDEEGVEWLQEL